MTGFRPDTDRNKVDDLERQLGDIIDSQIFSDSGNDASSIFGGLGGRNAAHGDAGGNRSSTPSIHTLTKTNTPAGEISVRTQNIIVNHATDTTLNLYWLDDAQKDGQIIKIKPKDTKTLVLKTGGNIDISTDVTITDTEYVELVFWDDANPGGAGKWLVIKSGSGGSTSFPLRYPLSVHGTIGLVTEVFDWNFQGHTATLSGDISVTFSNLPPSGFGEDIKLHFFHDGLAGNRIITFPVTVNNLTTVTISAGQEAIIVLTTDDAGISFHAYSESGIGAGSSQTPWTSDIDAATFNLDNLDRLIFDQAAGSALLSTQTGITSDVAKNLNLNVPTAAEYVFKVNDAVVNAFQIGATSILSQTITPIEITDDLGLLLVPWNNIFAKIGTLDNIVVDGAGNGITNIGHLDFVDNLATPAAALSLYSDGTDLFANTGGGVKNLSDIGGGSIVDLIAAEPVVSTNLTIFDDIGDMLINIGTVGKKIRIREQNTTPSIASFGNSLIDFNQTVDMNGNPIDNILRAIFDANAVPSTTQNEVAGTSSGLFLGTPNTKKIQFAEQGTVFLEMDKDVINPIIANAIDLGIQTTNPFKDLFLAGQANVLGNLTVGANTLLNGDTTLGFSSTDFINFLGTINTNVDFGDKFITDLAKSEFTDGIGNLVGDIRGVNASPDILEIRLGASSDFAISDNGTVRASYDNTLLTWSFQGSNLLKLPQETWISDRTTAPSTPSTGQVSLYAINVSGAQSLRVKFDNGTEKTIATDV